MGPNDGRLSPKSDATGWPNCGWRCAVGRATKGVKEGEGADAVGVSVIWVFYFTNVMASI